MDPPPLIDFTDDAAAAVSSATSHSYTDPHSGTRVFDRYLSSSSSYSSSASDDDGDTQSHSSNSTAIKRLDYMIDFLDRKLSTSDDKNRNRNRPSSASASSLPEFVGRGGDIPMFRSPIRAAVHPGRPPSLEVRPHPLRETQVGCFLRTIFCTEKQLWAGGENGLKVWSLKELYSESSDKEDGTQSFRESMRGVSSAMCMVGDEGSGVVWSGHRDGRVRCWKMIGQSQNHHGRLSDWFREALSWQAHRGPVLSLCISSYGIIYVFSYTKC